MKAPAGKRAGVLVGAAALVFAACGSHPGPAATRTAGANSSTPGANSSPLPGSPASATAGRHAGAAVCPLTGLPAPGGTVPRRPALAVKVENSPAARPQYGLTTADVVYEEPVEGGITRFIAIYQCRSAARVEPIRSGRFIDVTVVRQFGAHPLFAYAGAIPWVVDAVRSSPLVDVGAFRAPASDYWRDPDRYEPHNLVSSTALLWAAGRAEDAPSVPPNPVFAYGPPDPSARPAAMVNVAYLESDVDWTYAPAEGVWLRSYVGQGPALAGEGGQLAAANVVVMKAVTYPTPYVEDDTGAHENDMILTGSGPVQVFRGGRVVTGTWRRASQTAVTTLVDRSGHTIALTPGNTWVELVPTTVAVTVTR
ncbi:MAG TPA: DUF3048 domain-containing protein [Acidimicrobiales bacterium]|nr:DUF3048 domain-containing protein [Acidimicrobiales bacterium]